ncbi:MAG TPA: protein kinase [Polyangiaceae bacterium]|jgi:serine/threonine-protein kinase|nr:protein kinase [Polyangiaceae bacterium]
MKAPANDSVIARKYRLSRRLGEGAMGEVWQAEHLTLKSQVAVKFIQFDTASHPEALPRFLREAQAAASLRSPHVVQILDHGVDDGLPYIAMELLDGETLAARLARGGHLAPSEVAQIMTHIGRAIARAHEAGIVHRDLKPDNVFLVKNDDEQLAKVLDFGIAKSGGVSSLSAPALAETRSGAVMGTPHYMSPEQTEGAKGIDFRSDLWAMGVIAFECMLGRRPFEAETLGGLLLSICTKPMPIPSELGNVPAGFDAWFAQACARDVNQRFTSAKEAAQSLKSVCDKSAPVTSATSVWPVAPATASPSSQVESVLNASIGLAGQPAEGFASTKMGGTSAAPARSKRLVAVGLIALSAGALATSWFMLRSKPISGASALALTTPSATTKQGAASATVPSALPVTRANAAPVASAAPTATARPARKERPTRIETTPRAATSTMPWPNARSVNLGL